MSSLLPLILYRCEVHRIAVLPNHDSQTLIVFVSDRCDLSHCEDLYTPCTIHYSRFTLNGHELERAAFTLPQVCGAQLLKLVPVDRHGGFALHMQLVCPSHALHVVKKTMRTRASILFDETTFTFKDASCPVSTALPPYLLPEQIKWWKDTFYRSVPQGLVALFGRGMDGHVDISKVPLAYVGTRYLAASTSTIFFLLIRKAMRTDPGRKSPNLWHGN